MRQESLSKSRKKPEGLHCQNWKKTVEHRRSGCKQQMKIIYKQRMRENMRKDWKILVYLAQGWVLQVLAHDSRDRIIIVIIAVHGFIGMNPNLTRNISTSKI